MVKVQIDDSAVFIFQTRKQCTTESGRSMELPFFFFLHLSVFTTVKKTLWNIIKLFF